MGSEPAPVAPEGEQPALSADYDPIRARLLDAAAVVFAEEGFDGARVATIADRADLTTGAIYNRFAGKTELLVEALVRHNASQLDELLESGMTATDAVRAVGSELLEGKQAAWQPLILESLAAGRRTPELAEGLRSFLSAERAHFAEQITDAQAASLIDEDLDAAAIAMFCQAVSVGMNALTAIDSGLPSAPAWDELLDRLVNSLTPDESPQDRATETKTD